MTDPIMVIGSVFFSVLFAFLVFLFVVFCIAVFKKKPAYKKFFPEIAVLIPTYNEEKNIVSCLEAVFASDYPADKMSVYVVDDGSTDDTIALAKRYSITLLTQKHKGKTVALNYGVSKSKAPIIVTIDCDTFITPSFIREIVLPFQDPLVGATSGAVCVQNTESIMGRFQNIEYHYNNLIRQSFSSVFSTGVWFFGCLACYRRTILEEVGHFKTDTMCEDMDIALEIKKAGYKTINTPAAIGYTVVPVSFVALFWQRSRWWVGGLQSLIKHKTMFSHKSNAAILFLFVNHFWWAFYAFLSLPLFIYQIHYWLPPGASVFELAGYFFRWFSLSGPIYVLYMIPEWGLSVLNIFGVLSGILSAIMILSAILLYKDRFSVSNLLVIFFYFPYTIILNLVVAGSVIRSLGSKNKYFIK